MSIQETIEKKLRREFSPLYLDVKNESYLHNVPAGSESHFKVIVVSNVFVNLKLLTRHQRVNSLLKDEIKGSIHALSMETLTEDEWQNRNGNAKISPLCLGGGKNN